MEKNGFSYQIIVDIFPGDHEMVKKLLDLGTSVHSISNDGATSLHKAAEKGNFPKRIFDGDFQRNWHHIKIMIFTFPKNKKTIKIVHFPQGKEEAAQILLDNGANVNSQDNGGYTPLHRSAAEGMNTFSVNRLGSETKLMN